MEHQQNGLTFHITNNSGTYKPNNEHLEKAAHFLTVAFPRLNIQTHQDLNPLSSSSHQTDQEPTNFFTRKNLLVIILAFVFRLCCIIFASFN